MPGVIGLLRLAISFYKTHYKSFFVIGLLPIAISIIGLVLNQLLVYSGGATGLVILYVLLSIVLGLAGFVAQVIVPYALVKNAGEKGGGVHNPVQTVILQTLKRFWSILWVTILLVGIMIGSGIFLLIPAIILAGYNGYAMFPLMIEDKRGLSALLASFYYVRGNWWRVILRSLALAVLMIIVMGFITTLLLLCGYFILGGAFNVESVATFFNTVAQAPIKFYVVIGTFAVIANIIYWSVITPITLLYSYFIYKHLKEGKPQPVPESKTFRGWMLGLCIFGLIIMFLFVLTPFVFGVVSGFTKAREKALSNQQTGIENSTYRSESLFPSVASPFPVGDISLLTTNFSSHKTLKFSIRTPKTWEVFPDDDGMIINPPNIKNAPEAGFFIERIDLNLEALKMTESTIAEDVANTATQYNKDLKEVKFMKYVLGGKNMYVLSGTYLGFKNSPSISEFFIVIDNLQAYVITARSSVKDWTVAKPLIYSSISTFNVVK